MKKPLQALVIQPPLHLSKDFIDYPYFAGMGAYSAATMLLRRGWKVNVVDGFTGVGAGMIQQDDGFWLGETRESFFERLQGLSADLVLVTSNPFLVAPIARQWLRDLLSGVAQVTEGFLVVAEMALDAMHYLETDWPSVLKSLSLAKEVKLVLRYEGERLVDHLAQQIEQGLDENSIATTELWENREPFALDEVPLPSYEHLEAEAYFSFLHRVLAHPLRPGPLPAEPARMLPLVTSRGCPFGCVFCTKNMGLPEPRRQYRKFPLTRVKAWIEQVVACHGVERLVLLDGALNLESDRFDRILGFVESLGLQIDLPNGLRADRTTEAQIQRLKNLTTRMKVSLESASPRIQKILGKQLDPRAVERVATWCQRSALPLDVHLMIGIPGETRREIIETLRRGAHLHRRFNVRPLLQFASPLPGTELMRICEDLGLLKPISLEADRTNMQHQSQIETESFDGNFLGRSRERFQRRIDAPQHTSVVVGLTTRCNNRCVHCPPPFSGKTGIDAEISEVLERLDDELRTGCDQLEICGGEPTLHPGLLKLIRQAKERGFPAIRLSTNGRYLSHERFSRALWAAGLDSLTISLQGPTAELEAEITGDETGFAQTLAGLRNALKHRPEAGQIIVATTLLRSTLAVLPELAIMLDGLGVKRWDLLIFETLEGKHDSMRKNLSSLDQVVTSFDDLFRRAPSSLDIQICCCAPCKLPGHEDRISPDLGELKPETAPRIGVVGAPCFLSQWPRKRERITACDDCLDSLFCPGLIRSN